MMWGSTGSAPGQFTQPFGVEVAADGYVYVADQHNERVQVFTDTGALVTSWAIPPGPNGFAYPTGICVSNGVVWVSSNQGQHVTRWSTTGAFLGYAATPLYGWAYPTGIAADAAGNIFVCNSYYYEVIRLNSSGAYLGSFPTGALPYGIDIDAAGDIYVGCYGDNHVYKHNAAGNFLLAWGGSGAGPGQFHSAEGIIHDAAGDIYVCDTGNDRVQKFSPSGGFLCEFGGTGTSLGQMDVPSDIAVDHNGDLYVCEFVNDRIQRWTFGAVPAVQSTWGAIKARYR
jgi:streptogramin lyase